MTTPDKEEMPTDKAAGPWIVHYGEAVKIKDANGYTVASLSQIHLHGRRSKNEVEKTARFIVAACNAYELMREALILAEKADRIHSKCQECEFSAQAPEACGDCFPSADDARIARRNVLKSLGVRMRDVDRARVVKAERSICNCSQEDVHDYGPCGEHCRSQLATDPHDEDLSRLKDALQLADGAFESIRKKLVNNLDEPERSAFWAAVNARDSIRAALSTLPVNDRHHSGSDSYQADAGAPALFEKVNDRSEWLPIESAPHGPNLILAFRNDAGKWRRVIGWHAKQFEIEVDADELHSGLEEGPAGEAIYAKSGWYEYLDADEAPCNRIWPTHWQPLPSPPDAELNFSNDAERDGVSLNQTSSVNGIDALKEENLRLREALKPFSDIADTWTVKSAAIRSIILTLSNGERMCAIPAKAFVDARAALGGEQK